MNKAGPAERIARERARERRKQDVTCPKHTLFQTQTFSAEEASFILKSIQLDKICRFCQNKLKQSMKLGETSPVIASLDNQAA
jgi:hypothetical protein